MGNVQFSSANLRGLAFSIADLILIRAWAEGSGLDMVVRLDHGTETEEYEEVLAFHTGRSRPCRFIMWRDAESVYLQPLIGRTRRYGSVAEVIRALTPPRDIVLTDVMAPRWPDRASPAG
jgi:hypothetical protein